MFEISIIKNVNILFQVKELNPWTSRANKGNWKLVIANGSGVGGEIRQIGGHCRDDSKLTVEMVRLVPECMHDIVGDETTD